MEQLVLADELANARRANARDSSDNANKPKSEWIDLKKNSLNKGSPVSPCGNMLFFVSRIYS